METEGGRPFRASSDRLERPLTFVTGTRREVVGVLRLEGVTGIRPARRFVTSRQPGRKQTWEFQQTREVIKRLQGVEIPNIALKLR